MTHEVRSRRKVAFIDEYGGSDYRDLNRPGTTHHFIVAAVLVTDGDLETARLGVQQILRTHQTIRSRTIAYNDQKRAEIATALRELPFRFFALAVDKAELSRESGLIYREPFYKYLSGLLYGRLYRSVLELEVVADKIIDDEFMQSFSEYLHRRHAQELFLPKPRFAKSADEVMLQVADFIAGTLGRCLDPSKRSSRAAEFRRLLEPLELETLCWPPHHEHRKSTDPAASPHDRSVRRAALEKAFRYSHKHADSTDPDVRARLATLRYLIHREQADDPPRYVATKKLIEVVTDATGLALTVHQFRTNVIGPLRDHEMLIASSKNGYKLPSSARDIHDFYDQTSRVVEPMIRRVRAANTQVALATDDHVDLLAHENHTQLRKLVRA